MYNKKAFTFFEIAVTLAVLVIGITGFLSIYANSLNIARNNKLKALGAETARSIATYCVANNIKPTKDVEIPKSISGYYAVVKTGRLDQFEFNSGDESEYIEPNILTGEVNLNPNNNKDMEFSLWDQDGSFVNRDTLHIIGGEYSGTAIRILFRPKGNGNQNTLFLNNQPYPLDNGKVYTILGIIEYKVWNDKVNNGKAMGHWWLNVNSVDAVICENMDGGNDVAGDLLTIQVDLYENKENMKNRKRSVGTYFIRKWFRR